MLRQLERTCCFPTECNSRVCPITKRRKANEQQVVGGLHSTNEGMNKINAGGKASLQSYIKEETLAVRRDRNSNENEIGEKATIIEKETPSVHRGRAKGENRNENNVVDDALCKDPDAGKPHVRICEGLASQGASLLDPEKKIKGKNALISKR